MRLLPCLNAAICLAVVSAGFVPAVDLDKIGSQILGTVRIDLVPIQ